MQRCFVLFASRRADRYHRTVHIASFVLACGCCCCYGWWWGVKRVERQSLNLCAPHGGGTDVVGPTAVVLGMASCSHYTHYPFWMEYDMRVGTSLWTSLVSSQSAFVLKRKSAESLFTNLPPWSTKCICIQREY